LSSLAGKFAEKWKPMKTIPSIMFLITRMVQKNTTRAILFVNALVQVYALGQLECFII